MVKTLEGLGFAARRPHAADGRRVLVEATEAGLATVREIFPRFNALEGEITRELSAAEKEELARALRVMLHTVEA